MLLHQARKCMCLSVHRAEPTSGEYHFLLFTYLTLDTTILRFCLFQICIIHSIHSLSPVLLLLLLFVLLLYHNHYYFACIACMLLCKIFHIQITIDCLLLDFVWMCQWKQCTPVLANGQEINRIEGFMAFIFVVNVLWMYWKFCR